MDRRLFLAGFGALGFVPTANAQIAPETVNLPDTPILPPFAKLIADGALARVGVTTHYDPAYVKLAYPSGDVADDRGVCTDVVIRALRHAGVDLQKEVHEDMRANFAAYPANWGLSRPDRNIDHRRVPNLETFFARKGAARAISKDAADYRPGDIVSWRLTGSNLPHIGVVTGERINMRHLLCLDLSTAAGIVQEPKYAGPFVTHNIGAGAQTEGVLFDWPIESWFRFETWT